MAGKNASGSGSIRKRADGRWEARFTTGRDPRTGKQIQRSVYGKTQREVRQKLSMATSQLDAGDYVPNDRTTVAAWLQFWLTEYATPSVKPLTLKNYTSSVKNHIAPALGRVKLQSLTAMQVQRFYNDLLREKGLAPSSLKIVHGVLRQALQKAVETGIIRQNIATLCNLPRPIKTELKPFSDAETQAFLAAIQGHKYEMLFKVALFTGMRIGEILGLQWECVGFEQGTLLVNKQLLPAKGGYQLAPTKNGKPRQLIPAPQVMRLLKAQQARQAEMQLAMGVLWDNPHDLVFTNEEGDHLAHVSVSKSFKRVASQIGRPDVVFHDLRHMHAIACFRAGLDPRTVQEILGHATAAFTLEIYAHVTEEMKRESAAKLNAFIQDSFAL